MVKPCGCIRCKVPDGPPRIDEYGIYEVAAVHNMVKHYASRLRGVGASTIMPKPEKKDDLLMAWLEIDYALWR